MAINHERTTTIAFKLNNSIRKISSYNKFLQMMLRRFLCVQTSLAICKVNQLIALYMIGILIVNGLRDQSFSKFEKFSEN